MDFQEQNKKQKDIKPQEEMIENGKQLLLQFEYEQAQLCFKNALEQSDDKYNCCIQIAKVNQSYADEYLLKALEYSNQQIDRFLEIADMFENIYCLYITQYIHYLVKELNPNYDHEIPESYQDFQQIVQWYISHSFIQFAEKPIEKFLQLSTYKLETLMYLIKITLSYYSENLEIVETYCKQALLQQEDSYDIYVRIAELLKEHSLELSIKYYEGAKDLKPESFFAQIQIGSVLIKYQKIQEALQYFRSQQIPEQKQVYIDLGLLLLKSEETQEDGLEYLFKGIELSENKFDTLVQLANLQDVDGRKVQKLLLQKALEMRENDQNVLEQLAKHMCYYQIPSLEKLNIIYKVLEVNPESEFFIDYKCKTLLELGFGEELIEELNKGALQKICYKNVFLLKLYYVIVENLLFTQKKLKQGLDIFRIAVQYDPDAYYSIVVMLFENEYFEECIQLADEYIKLYPDDSQPYLFKGIFLEEKKAKSLLAQEKFDGALPFLEKTLEIQNNDEAKDLIKKIKEIKSEILEDKQATHQ